MFQRTGVLTFAMMLATTVALADQPIAAQVARQEQRRAAEQLEREATDASDFAKFAACGTAYLDLYNGDPKAVGADALLYNSAVCFESGKSVGAALHALALLRKSYPASPLAARALARQAALYGRIGSYDEAASRLEEYARTYPGEKDAPGALSDAMLYRLTFGPDAKAIEDATFASKLFKTKRPAETAAAMFALIGLYERKGGGEPLIAHLRSYLRNHAQHGGIEQAVIATVRLGEELWHKACPIRETDGLCVKTTRVRPMAKLGTARVKLAATVKQCGPSSTPKVVVVPRDVARTKEALQLFANAIKQLESRGITDPAALAAYARARVAVTDTQLETYLAVGFPKGLNFDPAKPAKVAASLKQFSGWIDKRRTLGGTATAAYEAVLGLKEPTAAIAATARLGQLAQAFADALHGAEIPADVRTGEFAEDKIEAFCGKMTEVAEPLYARADDAFKICLAKASELGIDDSFSRLCAREHAMTSPRSATDEVFAIPGVPTAMTLEPAIRSSVNLSAAFQTALAKVAETARTGWALPACRSHAAQFATLAKANPSLVDAQYMVGLSLHQCGLVDDARRAYEQTIKLRAGHPAAQSNLAELQWRAGNRDVAKRGWEAALAVDPKLYAAHVNLATAAIAELRALAETDAARVKLAAGARVHLQSALAVDDGAPAAFVALASLEADRAVVARFYIAEALKRAQKQVSPVLAAAAASARAERWAMAAERYRTALALEPTSSEARLGLALVELRLRRWDAARTELALVTVASYDHHVATGVALRNLDKLPEALAAYDKAIALLPARAEAHFDLGLLHTAAASQPVDMPTARAMHGKAAVAFRRASDLATGALKAEAKLRAELSDKTIVQIDAFVKSQASQPPSTTK